MTSSPRFTPVSDHAVLAELGDSIDADLHTEVLRLDGALAADPVPGMIEAVPAYANLLVTFDPLATDHGAVAEALAALLDRPAAPAGQATAREVEVCYDADLAPDLGDVARQTGLSEEEVIAAHLAGDYRVYLYGFAPGYAYMAGVPAPIRLPRKAAAKRDVPAGSVIIAGPQCLVTTITMPTGWWIIGRSPTRILTGDEERPFLFDVGDPVRFRRISRDRFEART
ncbi:5-oxoprolinase subunit B family protein [Oceaniglobus roseus]|uniref:5-oxoprolinase subunit B family protein n=1 Tax=Oceaniglobus roseus TaxID=1737570 RepID=UPI000C7F0270|nr:allophanate hydrolase subunit 1 [Kandeliimicrobium roseum]